MTLIKGIIIGFIFGTLFGITIMALLNAAKYNSIELEHHDFQESESNMNMK